MNSRGAFRRAVQGFDPLRHSTKPLNAKTPLFSNGVIISGGDEGARTLDPHVANVVLSQLSYIPINRQDGIFLPSIELVKHENESIRNKNQLENAYDSSFARTATGSNGQSFT